jgi:hypothetical protein
MAAGIECDPGRRVASQQDRDGLGGAGPAEFLQELGEELRVAGRDPVGHRVARVRTASMSPHARSSAASRPTACGSKRSA